jgi:hypothetical protein
VIADPQVEQCVKLSEIGVSAHDRHERLGPLAAVGALDAQQMVAFGLLAGDSRARDRYRRRWRGEVAPVARPRPNVARRPAFASWRCGRP